MAKGAGSKTAALAMAYTLLDAAQQRGRAVHGHELVADVLAGAEFKDGARVTDTKRRQRDDGREGRRVMFLHPVIHNI